MGFFQRIFGHEKPADAQVNPTATVTNPETGETVPPERVGPSGEYDQSGLAKRVVVAFESDSELSDLDGLWVAQTGSTVVLKGSVPSSDLLNKAVEIAKGVNGASAIDTNAVNVG
jgi:osmotically-inducible protein OsmY